MLGDADRLVLEDRKLLADFPREPPQNLDVERQLGDVVGEDVGLQGIRLVAPEHEAATLVAHVDVGVDHAGDRKLGPDPGDGLGDQELMPRRHDGQGGAEPRGDDPRPRARGVHHRARRDRAARLRGGELSPIRVAAPLTARCA